MSASAGSWLILAVILIVIELMTMGLFTIWGAGGALAAAAVSFVTDSFLWQCFCFAVVTLVLLLITRPLALRKVNRRAVRTNVNALIGQNALAESDIDKLTKGSVKIEGKIWTAVPSEDSVLIQKGDIVTITEVKGVTLYVKKEVE